MSNTRPTIAPAPNGPYLVKDLKTLRNSKGDALGTQPTVALCRCGQSERKPFCDGTEHRDQERDPAVLVSRNGPYLITGGMELADVPMGEGASR
jgi:CDGSH-type Zn-finger protein